MPDQLAALKARLAEIDDVDYAAAILEWDQLVMMPPAGGEMRSYQYATLQKLSHEMFIAPETGRLIDDLSQRYAGASPDDDDAALVRVAARLYRHKTQIPAALVAEMFQATAYGQEVWARARANNDFGAFLNAFTARSPGADIDDNCNLNINDFMRFLNDFAAGR